MWRVAVAAATVAVTAGCGGAVTPTAEPTPAPTVPTATATPTPVPSVTAPSPARSSPISLPTTPSRSPTTAPPTSASPTPTSLPAWLRDGVVTRLPTDRRVIALTFDGGAGAQGASSVLATLAREGVPATFFLTGRFARGFPQTTAAIVRGGYLVGNHTMTHPHLPALSAAAAQAEIDGAAAALAAVTGRSPRPWFRFPYGEYDAGTLALVHRLGYGAIGWTVDSRGWLGRSGGSADDVVQRVRAALRPGAIVLMHLGANPDDGTTYDAVALPGVIAAARAAGYGFVTVGG